MRQPWNRTVTQCRRDVTYRVIGLPVVQAYEILSPRMFPVKATEKQENLGLIYKVLHFVRAGLTAYHPS